MTPAQGIINILNAQQGLIVLPWQTFIGRLVPQDNIISAFDHAGRKPEAAVGVNYPAVQIILRGSVSSDSYSFVWDAAEQIFNVLQRFPAPTNAYPELTSCLAKTSPANMGYDEKDRPMVSLNFDLIVTPENAGHRE